MRVAAAFLIPCTIACTVLTACSRPVPSAQSDTALADTLKAIVADAYDFTKPDVVSRMNALYRADGQVVSASGGQIIANRDSIRLGLESFWQNVGSNMRDPHWTWGDVYVERLGRDAAVLTGTWSIPHIAPTNQPHVIRGAWTAVFLRVGGQWKIIQEHLSSGPSSATM
jgi:hypothetical protein